MNAISLKAIMPRFVYAELRPFADNETLIITPEGEMYHVDASPTEVSEVFQQCDGSKTITDLATTSSDPEIFTDILTTLVEETNTFSQQPPRHDEIHWARFMSDNLIPQNIETTHAFLLGKDTLIQSAQTFDLLPSFASITISTRHTLAHDLADYNPKDVLIIILGEYLDVELFKWADNFCHAAKIRWVPFHLEQGIGWLGPAIIPDYTPNYHDLLLRRATVAEDPMVHQAEMTPPIQSDVNGTQPFPSPNEYLWMLSTFFIEIERWLANAPNNILSTEIAADPRTFTLTNYPLLPLPEHTLAGDLQTSANKDVDILFNERAGIIVRAVDVQHHPSIPQSLKTVQLSLARMMMHDDNWHNDSLSGGSAFGDATAARYAAIGEAAERYCGNYFSGGNPIKASYDELIERGDYALDPEQLVLFSQTIYNTQGCPFTPFSRDLPVYWVKGHSLTKNRPAWLPMMLVYVNWNVSGFNDIPMISSAYYPGLAAGANLEHALISGIQELIERDSMMIWWLNRHPLSAVQLTPKLQALWSGTPHAMGQRAWAIYLPNEFNIPVMAGVVANSQEQLINIGFACRSNPIQATLKAWTEALTLQEGSRDLLDPNGLTRQGIAWNLVPDVLKPWRQDRAYRHDFRPDFRDITDLLLQQQFFLDPEAIEQIRPWVEVPANLTFDDVPHLPEHTLSTYQGRVEAKGYEIFYIDLTTSDIACAGLKVVRVLIPGLVPNLPAAFPPTGKGRIQNMPVQLGWRTTPLAESDLNYMPMPYA